MCKWFVCVCVFNNLQLKCIHLNVVIENKRNMIPM